MNSWLVGTACVTVVSLSALAAENTTWYVDDDNCPGPGSGTEADPYCSIQTAIDTAWDTDEIVVAPGTYFETIDFLGKAITLRSTDGPKVTIIDAQQTGTVVTCGSNTGEDTVLEGLTMTGGFSLVGAGMNTGVSSPTVVNCIFAGNAAVVIQGGFGIGGGMFGLGSPTVIGCSFVGNTAERRGGGMYLGGGAPQVIGCLFEANTTDQLGGGMYNDNAILTLSGCTFRGNSADAGGAMYNRESSPAVTNCILWGDVGGEIVDVAGSNPIVTYSDVQGGFPGTGNIDADPLFVDPDNGDLRLSLDSPGLDAGHNWGVAPDYADLDADGNTAELTPVDLDGNPRFVHAPVGVHTGCGEPAVVDMGAYEFPDGTAVDIRLGDIDGDGVIGLVDFLLLLDAWGPCTEECCLADFDRDGTVGVIDFLRLLRHWG